MFWIALCTPVAMLLLLFGMDAYEGFLAPPPPPEPDETEPPLSPARRE